MKPLISARSFISGEMNIINKPDVSKAIALVCVALATFVAATTVFFAYATFLTPMGFPGIVASVVSALVEIVMLLILVSLYRTSYILTNEEFIIKTTRLIGGRKTVPLKALNSVEKTLIPFGVSFHGGYYYVPSIGSAFLVITNFNDGLLVKTDHGNYIITPSDPLDFKEAIESRIEIEN